MPRRQFDIHRALLFAVFDAADGAIDTAASASLRHRAFLCPRLLFAALRQRCQRHRQAKMRRQRAAAFAMLFESAVHDVFAATFVACAATAFCTQSRFALPSFAAAADMILLRRRRPSIAAFIDAPCQPPTDHDRRARFCSPPASFLDDALRARRAHRCSIRRQRVPDALLQFRCRCRRL